METKTRTRKKKPEEDLKTLYYYREGVLALKVVTSSKLGLYYGEYVLIKKFDKGRRQFLLQNNDGDQFYSDTVTHVQPYIEGIELFHNSFPLLMEKNYQDGDKVQYRTRNNYASLRKKITAPKTREFDLFAGGFFNYNMPKYYNHVLGYCDAPLQEM
jgi:hypothetical protein